MFPPQIYFTCAMHQAIAWPMLNRTVLFVVCRRTLNVEMVADVIDGIGLTLVLIPVEGLQDIAFILGQCHPRRFEPVHVLNSLSVPLLQHIDFINGCDDAVFVCLRIMGTFRHSCGKKPTDYGSTEPAPYYYNAKVFLLSGICISLCMYQGQKNKKPEGFLFIRCHGS